MESTDRIAHALGRVVRRHLAMADHTCRLGCMHQAINVRDRPSLPDGVVRAIELGLVDYRAGVFTPGQVEPNPSMTCTAGRVSPNAHLYEAAMAEREVAES